MFLLLFLFVALCAVAAFWPTKKEETPLVPRQRRPNALTRWWSIKKEDLRGASHSSASSSGSRTDDRERDQRR